jgi:hypothetical protein
MSSHGRSRIGLPYERDAEMVSIAKRKSGRGRVGISDGDWRTLDRVANHFIVRNRQDNGRNVLQRTRPRPVP